MIWAGQVSPLPVVVTEGQSHQRVGGRLLMLVVVCCVLCVHGIVRYPICRVEEQRASHPMLNSPPMILSHGR